MTLSSSSKLLVVAGATLALLAASPGWLHAQEVGQIRGRVVDANTLRPLSGVQVTIPGTLRGALTDGSGEFDISDVSVGEAILRAKIIGYAAAEQRVTAAAGEVTSVEFSLRATPVELDEIIVTGTPGAVEKRTLGNSVTTLQAAELTEHVVNQTISELLQGKTSAVTYLQSSGSPGTSGVLKVRGANSVFLGNDPVVYVDGVRINTGHAGNFINSCCGEGTATVSRIRGGQHTLSLDFLNPEDIESVEVIKGPAAATLYGADAAGGVIQIITKKGRPGAQALRWDLRVRQGWVDWLVDPLRNFGTCTADRKAATREVTIDEVVQTVPAFPGCQAVADGTVLDYAGLKDTPGVLRKGGLQNYSLSVSGGGDGYSFFVAGDLDDEEGVFQNSDMQRASGRANFAFYPTERLDFAIQLGYTESDIRYPLADEDGRALSRSAVEYEPGEWLPDEQTLGFAWIDPAEGYKFDNTLSSERLTLGTTVNYVPVSWFRNRLTVGLDYHPRLAKKVSEPNSAFSSIGNVRQRRLLDRIITVDYAGTIATPVPGVEELESRFSFGSQWIHQTFESTYAEGEGYASPVQKLVNQGAETRASDSFSREATLGLFAQEQLAWKDRLFVTGGVRVDNSSVFGDEVQSIFYPKLQVSWVASDEAFFDVPAVEELRLRAAWGAAGSVPGAFAAPRTFSDAALTRGDGSSVPAVRLSNFGNSELEPERGEEIELGFDASLFEGRVGLEFTYYNQRTKDALMLVPVPPSTGFTGSQWQNIGETLNRGIETTVSAIPVQSPDVSWETRVNLYTNDNELVEFGFERDPLILCLYGCAQRHIDRGGYPLGGYWANFPQRNAQGELVTDASGGILMEDETRFIGPALPTREIGWSNTLTLFGNLRIYTLLDYKGGHFLFNYTDMSRCYRTRLSCKQVNPPNALSDEESALLSGQWKDGSIAWASSAFWDRTFNFIQKADFVKLRDVAVTYTLPTTWIRWFAARRASVTFAGHNLMEWSPDYTGPDPEASTGGTDEFWRAYAYGIPQFARFSIQLNVGF